MQHNATNNLGIFIHVAHFLWHSVVKLTDLQSEAPGSEPAEISHTYRIVVRHLLGENVIARVHIEVDFSPSQESYQGPNVRPLSSKADADSLRRAALWIWIRSRPFRLKLDEERPAHFDDGHNNTTKIQRLDSTDDSRCS
jgi:hypothetical protein